MQVLFTSQERTTMSVKTVDWTADCGRWTAQSAGPKVYFLKNLADILNIDDSIVQNLD